MKEFARRLVDERVEHGGGVDNEFFEDSSQEQDDKTDKLRFTANQLQSFNAQHMQELRLNGSEEHVPVPTQQRRCFLRSKTIKVE